MNPENHNTPSSDANSQSAEAWFDSINSPPAATAPTPKKHRPLLFLIATAGICILISIGVLGFALLPHRSNNAPSAKQCLSSQDYTEFAGTDDANGIDSRTNFYTASIDFKSNSTTYSPATRTETQQLFKSIGLLYSKHIDETSISITLSTSYFRPDAASLTADRLETIKTSLADVGVPEQIIKAETPTFIEVEPDYPYEDTPVLLSITSSSNCQP